MTRLSNSVVSLFTPATQQRPNEKVLSVGELVLQVRQSIESGYRDVAVVGEISSFKPWRSGHWYFDLKDEQALLPAVMFRANCGRVRFELKDGMKVLLRGRVSVYAPQSKLQILVEEIEPIGQGALALAFEQLKKKLEHEGLFDPAHKKPLPTFPLQVGLVTSPQGAALQDMLRIFKQRMPGVNLLLAPVRVQGPGAADEIADALKRLDAQGCDVIIVGRGGGSLEDLWAFNDECLARTIFACATPIVSAVGHETDFSIADYVSDLRCATPTHAAQTVVLDRVELEQKIALLGRRMHRQIKALVSRYHLALERIAKKIKEPRVLLFRFMQRVDEASMRLTRVLTHRLGQNKSQTKSLATRLANAAPHVQLARKRAQLQAQADRLHNLARRSWQKASERLHVNVARLSALSPLQVLARGYAVTYRPDASGEMGQVIARIDDAQVSDQLRVRVSDGNLDVTVTGKSPC